MATSFPLLSKSCQRTNDCKQKAIGLCDGCQRWYCHQHFDEHRRSLGQEMDLVIDTYDQVQNLFAEKSRRISEDSMFKEIDEWERDMQIIIQEKAAELRRQMLQLQELRMDSVSQKLGTIAVQLQESQKQNSFVERDLENWTKKLTELKSTIEKPSIIKLELYNHPLIAKTPILDVKLNEEGFEKAMNPDVQFDKEGAIVSYNGTGEYTEIRGKMLYEFGRHQIRIQIEQHSKRWVFLGINSAQTPLQNLSWKSPSTYGWCNDNYFYLGGDSTYRSPLFERFRMEKDDIITLIFHCEAKQIRMINEHTQAEHILNVDLEKCPLPWQLHVILRDKKSCLRLLRFTE